MITLMEFTDAYVVFVTINTLIAIKWVIQENISSSLISVNKSLPGEIGSGVSSMGLRVLEHPPQLRKSTVMYLADTQIAQPQHPSCYSQSLFSI